MEFVAFDEYGKEREWINPVESIQEHADHYLVDNGWHEYRVEKHRGWTYITRPII